ncbi:hypothetical protein [Dyadobacter psychrotolerans]|uniref:Chondroitin AC lyase n=1 Tax=Dyadobacter psychrotolerans TaxID=2541721 RepID=A0A4R5DID6_9BACT|nr:hypothetical protein [Dyadobacter psychrotolerans]TDE10525.1 hypothetical protein E0F88_27985 [Dyadobacter psychrotolerans]
MTQLYRPTILLILFSCLAILSLSAQPWPKVKDVDLSKLKPSDFTDDELDLPYYLKHFHTVANSVRESDPDKGFIDLPIWRRPADNKPYNARIMENILSLAYFYSTKRPWNPYYKDPAVKIRIEAALHFWIRLQDSTGRFSEYGVQKWNLAGTSFATLCMGRTLEFLEKTGGIDSGILRKTREADRKAIMFILRDKEFYDHGKNYTNQFTACFPGALAYIKLYPDKEMEVLLKKKIAETVKDFQSPAGFFYEGGGTDHGYNLNTHHSNMRLIYDFTRNSEIGKGIIEEEKRYVDWIALNSVKEPDSKFFTLNRATETRTSAPVIAAYFPRSPLGGSVELLRAFTPSKEEIDETNKQKRKQIVENWPEVDKLEVYSPTILLHLNRYQWYPTNEQKQAAVKKLPYFTKSEFIQQRTDSRQPTSFTFIRQPGYYAVFNSGPVINKRQRYGLGLLWNSRSGSFLQSQADSDVAAWGTKAAGGKLYESGDLPAKMTVNGQPVIAQPGISDFPAGVLTVIYALGSQGEKSLKFDKEQISVTVKHAGAFTETLPLLINEDDKIDLSKPGEISLRKNGETITIIYDDSAKPRLEKTSLKSGTQSVVSVVIETQDKLIYVIKAQK